MLPGNTMGIFAPSQPLQKETVVPGTRRSLFSWAEQSHPFDVFGAGKGKPPLGPLSGAAAADASPHLVAKGGQRDLCGPINAGEINERLPLAEYF